MTWEGSDLVLSLWTHSQAQEELGRERRNRNWLQLQADIVVSVSVPLTMLILCRILSGLLHYLGKFQPRNHPVTPLGKRKMTPKHNKNSCYCITW